VEFATTVMTMNSGDLIACGTNHEGLGALQDGETVEIEIERIGRMALHVGDPLVAHDEHGCDLARVGQLARVDESQLIPVAGGERIKLADQIFVSLTSNSSTRPPRRILALPLSSLTAVQGQQLPPVSQSTHVSACCSTCVIAGA